MPKETGGSAFPIPRCCDNPTCPCTSPGMTLRDWFAGMVAQGLANGIVERGAHGMPWIKIAFNDTAAAQCSEISYRMADAMLKEREKE